MEWLSSLFFFLITEGKTRTLNLSADICLFSVGVVDSEEGGDNDKEDGADAADAADAGEGESGEKSPVKKGKEKKTKGKTSSSGGIDFEFNLLT